ncbi:MAG: hypothetical protein WAN28_22935, partial [Terracidiphilus sp.]
MVLPRVTRKENACLFALREFENPFHLPPRNHPGFIDDQDPAAQRRLCGLVIQQSGDGHRIAKADLVQFLDRAPRWRNGSHFAPGVMKTTTDLLECGRLARSGSAAQIDGKIAGVENLMNSALLFVTQMFGRMKVAITAEPPVPVYAVVYQRDYPLFALQAVVGGQAVSCMNERSLGPFNFECAAQLAEVDLTAAMAQSFGQQFMIVNNGAALEEM